jgi:prepilin-type N-terminal cleavage/methylation domain-containing protein|tara:strand:+ start:8199 stop:8738 length:540 start_codon:yes stop_codon:yes gene_type:complete
MRRGFTVIEFLIGMAIAAILLMGLFVSIHSSVDAYERSAADGVNRLTSRLLVERIALLVRTGSSFGPLPANATINEVESDTLEITTPSGQNITITWNSVDETLEMDVDGTSSTVLGGVSQLVGGITISPFLLQYENGTSLQRVTVNLAVIPDPEHATSMDGGGETLRLTASVMPRAQLY